MLYSVIKKPKPRIFLKKNTMGVIIPEGNHPLSPMHMSSGSCEIVTKLQKSGFDAFLVGGCVRDALLGLNPKDFDIATNANPKEIKLLFNRAKIIGRRFQIVHIQLHREIIEVTTFRSNQKHHRSDKLLHQTKTGMLTRDNVFGSIKDDANRRDLSINALYYNPTDNSIHDFLDSLTDIKKNIIRIIGDPTVRFKEDPVRLLRVVRFSTKLNFKIDSKTAEPMYRLGNTLPQISAPRLFEECLKLFLTGHAFANYKLLNKYNFMSYLMPCFAKSKIGADRAKRLVSKLLTNTDQRVHSGKPVTPAFTFAALLWPEVQKESLKNIQNGKTVPIVKMLAADEVLSKQIQIIAIPRRHTTAMREIWQLQVPLQKKERAARLMGHPRFRAAYDLLLLREESGESLGGAGTWWTKYQEQHPQNRPKKCKPPKAISSNKSRRRKYFPPKLKDDC